jgi:hypothetical protein
MDEVVTEWGEIATAGKAAGSLGPAWKMFIKTKFFVAIRRSPDDDPKNFLLHMDRDGPRGAATLIISELRERLDPALGDAIIPMSGTDIVCRIEDDGAIQVALTDSSYSISKKRVEWLRSGIKMTKERIEIPSRRQSRSPPMSWNRQSSLRRTLAQTTRRPDHRCSSRPTSSRPPWRSV